MRIISLFLELHEHMWTMNSDLFSLTLSRINLSLLTLYSITIFLFSGRGAAQCVPVTGKNKLQSKSQSTSYRHYIFFADMEVQQNIGFKPPNLQALPISIILMTSSAQPTCLSWRPTTWTCCLPSSRTRSFDFLFKRSNTYNQATRLRQIWTNSPL